LLAALLAVPASAGLWTTDLKAALTAAGEKGTLVFVDLFGPSCAACRVMEDTVLSTPEMERLRGRLELVKLDTATPEGERFKKEHRILGVPTYIVLDPRGEEVGLLLGERRPAVFFAQLEEILAKRTSLKEAELRAAQGGPCTLPEARAVISAHAQRRTAKEGLAFFAKLPDALRRQAEEDPAAGSDLQRLRLYLARDAQRGAACAAPARRLLELNQGFLDAYDLFLIRACSSYQPEQERRKAFEVLRAPLEKLLAEQLPRPRSKRTTDFGILTSEAEWFYESNGPKEKLEKLRKNLGR